MLGAPRQAPVNGAALAALEPQLHAMSEPIHSMSLSAAHHVAEQIDQRNTAVRQHNQIGLMLTVFLSLLVLAFGLMAMRQMRLLGDRQRALVDLTGHLREAQRLAEQASDAKSVFLANMSHEIRTPFHGLLGMLSLLRETGLNARQVDYLRTATESADHLLTILNDVLDMSLLESGRLALTEEPVNLRDLLREVEALMRPQAQLKSLALHIDADPGVPEQVRADRTRVKQVLFNLLNNAVKFSDRGVVVLDLHRAAADDGVEQLEFVVTDTGIGMDQATLDRLFQRFSQGDESRSRRHGGTGLGLEISRSLARLMGGDVTAKSVPGEGSSFSFRMPLHAVSTAPPAPAPRTVSASVATAGVRLAARAGGRGPSGQPPVHGRLARRHGPPALLRRQWPGSGAGHPRTALRHRADGPAHAAARRRRGHAVDPCIARWRRRHRAHRRAHRRCLCADARALPDGRHERLPRQAGQPGETLRDAAATVRRRGPCRRSCTWPLRTRCRPAPASSVLDRGTLDAALRAMPRERLAQLLASFFDQGPEMVERLRLALRDGQALDLRVNAHAARGAALNFGLSALAQTAQALHEGATHVPAHEIARLIQRFEDLLVSSRDACEAAGLLEPVTG